MPGQRAGALLELLDDGVERRRRAVAELGRPDGDRGAVLDLAPVPITPPAPQPMSSSGASASWTASSVASGAARWAPDANTTARSHGVAAEPSRAVERRLERRGARVGARRQAGADADGHSRPTILRAVPPPTIVALFGPTGVGKTAVAIALAERLRAAARTRSPSRPTRCRSTGPADAHRRGDRARSRRGSSTGCSASCPIDATFCAGAYARARPRRDRRAARSGPPPDRRRRHRPVPARRARRARPAAARRRRRSASAGARARDARARRRCTPSSPRAPGRRRHRARPTASASSARSSCSTPASAAAAGRTQLWTDRHPPPDAARRPGDGPRGALRSGSTRASTRWSRPARSRRSERRTRPAPPPPPARRSASRSCCAGDVEAMKTRTRRYAKRQLTWMRKLPGAHLDRRHRPRRRRTSPPSCSA